MLSTLSTTKLHFQPQRTMLSIKQTQHDLCKSQSVLCFNEMRVREKKWMQSHEITEVVSLDDLAWSQLCVNMHT